MFRCCCYLSKLVPANWRPPDWSKLKINTSWKCLIFLHDVSWNMQLFSPVLLCKFCVCMIIFFELMTGLLILLKPFVNEKVCHCLHHIVLCVVLYGRHISMVALSAGCFRNEHLKSMSSLNFSIVWKSYLPIYEFSIGWKWFIKLLTCISKYLISKLCKRLKLIIHIRYIYIWYMW